MDLKAEKDRREERRGGEMTQNEPEKRNVKGNGECK